MATRGYFTIQNTHVGDPEYKDYLGFEGDMLVEAYHDGYVDDMLFDILAIPYRLFRLALLGRTNSLFTAQQSDVFAKRYRNSEEFIAGATQMQLPFEPLCTAVYELLLLTKPFKYHHIAFGADRYTRKVGYNDSRFSVRTTVTDAGEDYTSIFVDKYEHGNTVEEGHEDEYPTEYSWAADIIRKVNSIMQLKDFGLAMTEEGEVRMCIRNAFLEMYWEHFLSHPDLVEEWAKKEENEELVAPVLRGVRDFC